MLDALRDRIRDLMAGRVAPGERGAVLSEMKETLVRARLGVEDLRALAAATRSRLEAERAELETVRRRKRLAEGIRDTETVAIAERYERQHAERIAVLEKKLEAQDAEGLMVDSEVAEMTLALRGAMRGAGSAQVDAAAEAASIKRELDPNESLREDIDSMARSSSRAAREAAAEEHLAALKRKMGK